MMSFRLLHSLMIIIVLISSLCLTNVTCFMSPSLTNLVTGSNNGRDVSHKTILQARRQQPRRGILDNNKDGDIFKLKPFSGNIEFGNAGSSTIRLSDDNQQEALSQWLQDTRQVALSIWDGDLIQDLGDNVFRLELMSLQLVTIELKPSVDVKMWTEEDGETTIFKMQSVGFDPNIKTLPFVGISPDSLLLQVEVEGVLSPTEDGNGLTGRIGFLCTGVLPPPMRMVPEPILKAAITTINRTVSAFAMYGFQQGVKTNFRKFLRTMNKVNV